MNRKTFNPQTLISVLAVICLLAVLPNAEAQTCHRSCYGYYKVEINSPKIGYNILDLGFFEARRGCGCNVPDRCRRRARDAAQACMKLHSQKTGAAPGECKSEGVLDYWAKDFTSFIKGEVCDYLKWKGKDNVSSVKVTVSAETNGYAPCKQLVNLKPMTFDCPCKLGAGANKPLAVTSSKTSPVTFSLNNGKKIERFVEVIRKGAVSDIRLYLNEGDKNAKKMLSNYNAQGDGDYQGCGPKAAQNVLRYFGIEMKQKDIRQYVHTHKVNVKGLDDGRFTTPVELEDGLRAILKKNGIKDIEVVRVSGKSAADIQGMLDNGFPVICLVDKGHHWVSIAGIRSSYFGADKRNQQFYVMNNWNMEVRNWSEMGLQFDDAAEAAMNALKVFAGGTSYKPGTLIYFKRKS